MGQPLPPERFTAYAPHETPPARPGRAWGAAAIGVVVGLLLAVAAGADLAGFQDLIDVTKSKVNTGTG
ncbi:hypothetical protein [Nakamurella sp. PAMC28650]|uniref:hypothetical protein n=1 Tax=Nakamurella sp. PAMC28650 TaxID=2762325 RepID=UPI00164DB491|nr:hypothetical protein [Nakamurella sp. PAMC28650]QNK80471.1 hypothetical protein H7F38_20185 [Nakamurella sp. PAMC28650]